MKVIKIGAVWCLTCLVMKPRWQQIEQELPWLKTEYFDYDSDQEKIKEYGVTEEEVPVFVFLDKDNRVIARLSGEQPKKKLIQLCEEHRNA